jgi:hypothetical protein
MALKPLAIQPVPAETGRVARTAFLKGNPYLTLRDALGPIFQDEGFAARQEVWCPQGKRAVSWTESTDHAKKPWVSVQFSRKDCTACPTWAACTRARHKARSLQLPPREQYEALQAMWAWYASAEGRRQRARRASEAPFVLAAITVVVVAFMVAFEQ